MMDCVSKNPPYLYRLSPGRPGPDEEARRSGTAEVPFYRPQRTWKSLSQHHSTPGWKWGCSEGELVVSEECSVFGDQLCFRSGPNWSSE
jgi:hypothetical protein